MTLYLIGLGLCDEKDFTLRGIEAAKKCKAVYLETYTSLLKCDKSALEEVIGKPIYAADRNFVEKKGDSLIQMAKTSDVALLIIGDPLCATTHQDIIQRAKKENVKVEVIHNASVMTAVGITGLQVYKFGRTTSIPFPDKDYMPETPYNVIKENKSINAHTLLLLDLRPDEHKFMSVNDAIQYLLKIEEKRNEKVFTKDTFCIGCARLGCRDESIISGTAENLLAKDFKGPLHCIIIPSKMHFIEDEAVKRFS